MTQFSKAIQIALILYEKDYNWLQNKLGVSRQAMSAVANGRTCQNWETVKRISEFFGMDSASFLALGDIERATSRVSNKMFRKHLQELGKKS